MRKKPGDNGGEETPVPIPNTEVKLPRADGTAWATVWESRTSPRLNDKARWKQRAFFWVRPAGRTHLEVKVLSRALMTGTVSRTARVVIARCRYAERYWHKMLRSRSRKSYITWERFNILKQVFPLQRPKLSVPYMRMKALAVL